MNADSVSLNGTALHDNAENRVALGGGSVMVRIVSDEGNDRYTAFVGGTRMAVSSELKFTAGTVFPGSLSFRDGKIIVVPVSGGGNPSGMTVIRSPLPDVSDIYVPVPDVMLSAAASAAGLPDTALSVFIMAGLRKYGLGTESAARVFRMASRFPGMELKAVSVMLLLLSGGIPVSEGTVASVMSQLYHKTEACSRRLSGGSGEEAFTGIAEDSLTAVVKEFAASVFGGRLPNRPGILTVVNHAGIRERSCPSCRRILIPFELSAAGDGNDVLAGGFVGISFSGNRMESLSVSAETGGRKSFFLVRFLSRGKISVRFRTEAEGKSRRAGLAAKLRELLASVCAGADVAWEDGGIPETWDFGEFISAGGFA